MSQFTLFYPQDITCYYYYYYYYYCYFCYYALDRLKQR